MFGALFAALAGMGIFKAITGESLFGGLFGKEDGDKKSPSTMAPVEEATPEQGPKTGTLTDNTKRFGLGNIDLLNRPVVPNEDGSISTVRSVGVNIDGQEVLLPTVSPEGKILSTREAVDLYKRTGQYLGKFKTPEESNAYAQRLHTDQEQMYSPAAPPSQNTPGMIKPQDWPDDEQVPSAWKKIFPDAKPEIINTLDRNDILSQYGINTPERKRQFIAQMGWESDGFSTTVERASGKDYEGRKDLGNIQQGDGERFKGRGIIQLTGRSNYQTYGKKLGLDLERNPDLAADPEVALKIAGQYWKDKGLNELADKGDLRGITRRINGGYNGLSGRQSFYNRLGGI